MNRIMHCSPRGLLRAVCRRLGMRDEFFSRPEAPEKPACRGEGPESLILPPLQPGAKDELVELTLRLDGTRAALNSYRYSKLYYCTDPAASFSEEAVICFEVPEYGRSQTLQIALPASALAAARQSACLRLRLDALPYSEGSWQLEAWRLVSPLENPALTAAARRVAHRQWVREQVLLSERERRVELPHYPESVSIELTSLCNLRCPHCSSHGMPHLHKHHNLLPEMPLERFRSLAEESFPHVSVVSIVGRGEPTLASDELWHCLIEQLRKHGVRVSCVTNGTRIRQRFSAADMPLIHELTFSIDGDTAETFESNRLGAKFDEVMDNLRYYHELRNAAPLARRPQLTISWTLKRNNVAELPDFVRRIAEFEPDLLSIRHMVIFQDKERSQSLLDYGPEANAALREAYAEMARLGLRHESPALMPETPVAPAEAASSAGPAVLAERENECNWMHRTAIIMADGEVTSCGKHYGAQMGHLNEQTTLWDVWNGANMQSLRRGFGGPEMWDQCKACWLREIKWHTQRQAKDHNQAYDHDAPMDFSAAAWDYREYSEL